MDVRSRLLRLKEGLTSRDRELVNSISRDLIEVRAPLGRQWHSIAMALAANGEWRLAFAAADRFEAETDGPAAIYARGNLLHWAGRFEEALAVLEPLPVESHPIASERLADLNLRASLAFLTGRTDQSRSYLSQALQLDPNSGQAWFTFADLADFRGMDAEAVSRLERAFASGASVRSEATKLAHAVGRMRHQLRDFAGAFAAYDTGAELFRTAPGSRVRPQPYLAEKSIAFPPDLIHRVSSQVTVPHERVIFVSGLPRSGTTLVEQILVSHPDVMHGEELNFMVTLANEIGGIDAASLSRWLDAGGDPNRLVELYLHLADERLGPEGRFVDKTIEAGNYMGLLLALFPKAPIFWLRREPVDNGWSAFRTMFASGAAWSWDLEHIGLRLWQEQRMINHWSREAPNRITFLDYEALVREPERYIRLIAEAARLKLDERMFSPHRTKRAVATASAVQVREPINLKGLGVAEPYHEWLAPMIHAFEAHSAASRASSAL